MSARTFVDYYDVLQVSSDADPAEIERSYRTLMQAWQRDRKDPQVYEQLVDAYKVLSDAFRRSEYDIAYEKHYALQQGTIEQNFSTLRNSEQQKRWQILSVLYRRRMEHPTQPGLTAIDLERLLRIPKEELEFALWYVRERGFIRPGENGRFMITVSGVDAAEEAAGDD